jgi:uncharacterized membrane protein YeiB
MSHKPKAPRLAGLDLARYLAFVGMVIVNFKIVMGAEGGSGFASYFMQLLEGRAAATFVVLAGLGLGLAHARSGAANTRITLKRAAFLLAIGLVNMLIFDADILHYYAFYFLFGAFLLPLSTRALIWAIALLNLAFVTMIFTLDYDIGWNWEDYSYTGFWTPSGFLRNLFFNGWHPVVPWLGFLLFGIVLSRLPLAARRTQRALALAGLAALLMASALSRALSSWLAPLGPELADLLTTSPIPPMPLYTLAGLGAASFTIGLCLMAEVRLAAWGVLALTAPAGRQTLTLYIAHILIGMGTLEALGLVGGQTPEAALLAALLFCAAATLYARLWTRRFRRGPVEALMRRLAG